MTHISQLAGTALLFFLLGWACRSALSKILNRLAVKIICSHLGNKLVLEVLEDGIRKLGEKGGAK